MLKLMINLPCKVSDLESKIRSFCEVNGCHDKAVVNVVVEKNPFSFQDFYRLEVSCPEKDGAK